MSLPREYREALSDYRASSDLLGLNKAIARFRSLPALSKNAEVLLQGRIAIVSNYSTQFVEAALPLALLQYGVSAQIFAAEFNQWELAPRDRESNLYRFQPDLVVFLLSSMGLALGGDAEAVSGRISTAIASTRKFSSARIVLTIPEPLPEEVHSATWAYSWRRRVQALLERDLAKEVVLLDLEPLLRQVGSAAWHAERYYITSKLPFHPKQTRLLADHLASVIADLISPRVKLVITDLDNTLWRGVVGEVGHEGVNLDVDGVGYSYLRLQMLLRQLNEQGVLLAVVSKNNRQDALEVFRNRREMILEEKNFAAMAINWEPKAQNILKILKDLNLSTAGVVFLDDSPFEREGVRAAFPDLMVPDLAGDPTNWVDALVGSGAIARYALPEEGRERVALYEAENRRKIALESHATTDEYLAALELTLATHGFRENEQRVIDLIAKTNQFNLTGRRHNRQAIVDMVGRGARVFVFSLSDRFGEYGIISTIIVVPGTSGGHHIDTWAMSCRVIGRTAEIAMMAHVATVLRDLGSETLTAEFIPGKKNALVESLYDSLGFQRVASDETRHLYQRDLLQSKGLEWSHHCRVVRGQGEAGDGR